ncbi:HAMP domain-containing histidine kinase [Nonomuraea sp. NBC_01738]|uniref:HAMP domain-containing sensor histidine kinase n=1 Tax=Nonomuraea sp. NBC_01738 TaxID=2976003 RepID=UPI002E10ADFD|nr:HAMP domain-containing histidine kinase [Nonomuraea sp. NBC_01738]
MMGLRGRVGLALAGTAVLVAAVIGVLVHTRMAAVQESAARQGLDERFLALLERHALGEDAGLVTRGVPAELARTVTSRPVRATYLDGATLWAAAQVDGQVVGLSRSYAPESSALAALDRTLLTSGLATALAASLGGVALASGLSRRARRVARTATKIAGGDLSARVEPVSGNDEVAMVGRAVDAMADALEARIEAERRVTADIAHELRTPVAGLVTAAGLLPPGRPTELVQDRAAVLRKLVEDVIEVARLDAGAERPAMETREVSALARRAIAAATAVHPEAAVRLEIVTDAEAETDPRRVERVLANLVTNALRHGAAPVTVTVDGRTVTVADSGPGFPEPLLEQLRRHGPRRFATGSAARGEGVGLGLTIASGQAAMLGAGLEFANTDRGAEAVLRLP